MDDNGFTLMIVEMMRDAVQDVCPISATLDPNTFEHVAMSLSADAETTTHLMTHIGRVCKHLIEHNKGSMVSSGWQGFMEYVVGAIREAQTKAKEQGLTDNVRKAMGINITLSIGILAGAFIHAAGGIDIARISEILRIAADAEEKGAFNVS